MDSWESVHEGVLTICSQAHECFFGHVIFLLLFVWRKIGIGITWFKMHRSVEPLLRLATRTTDTMRWRSWSSNHCFRGALLTLLLLLQRHPDPRVAYPAASKMVNSARHLLLLPCTTRLLIPKKPQSLMLQRILKGHPIRTGFGTQDCCGEWAWPLMPKE